MTFKLFPWRFFLLAQETIRFPEGKSGNVLRGAFGSVLRRIACVAGCTSVEDCEFRNRCDYARIFEPADAQGPSGLQRSPRPFVLRATHLDGSTIRDGERFHLDLYSFQTRDPIVSAYVLAIAALAREGIGPRRGRAELLEVWQLDEQRRPAAQLYSGGEVPLLERLTPMQLDLSVREEDATREVMVRFLTPTELKAGEALADRPEFPVLFGRARDRVSTLGALYGEGPLNIDFRAMGERAAAVRLTHSNLRHIEAHRRSSRTAQVHPLGGFVGEVKYEGAVGEFLPYLRAAEWTGVGRQTVWGKGDIRVIVV